MILTSELPSLQWSSHEIYDSVSPNPAGLSEQSIGWRWPFSDAPAGTRLDREGGGAQPGWHGPGQRPGHGDLLAGLQDVLLHMAWDLLDDLHLHHGCPTHQNHLILIGWLRSTPLCPWRNQPSSFCLIWSTWGEFSNHFLSLRGMMPGTHVAGSPSPLTFIAWLKGSGWDLRWKPVDLPRWNPRCGRSISNDLHA